MLVVGNTPETAGSLTVSNNTGGFVNWNDYKKWIHPSLSISHISDYPTTDWKSPVSNALADSIASVLFPCRIEKVIFHDPATVVIWKDKSKTVVKCHNEPFDPEKGLAMAVCKKLFGDSYKKTFREYCGKEENK